MSPLPSVPCLHTDAILTSYKTILKDEASFTIRIEGNPIKETNLVIIDKDLTLLNKEYNTLPIFYNRTNTKIYFITDKKNIPVNTNSIELIEGVFNSEGLVYSSITDKLLDKGLYSILAEGGQKINASLMDQNIADELYWFIAPKLLNDQQAIPMLGIDKKNQLVNAYNLELVDTHIFQEDILLHYLVK